MKSRSCIALLITAAIVFIFTWSCRKSAGSNPSSPDHPATVQYVTASVSGRVVDLYHQPVSGATVNAISATTTTDINGNFTFSNIQLDKNAGYISAQKNGYFNGSKTFQLTSGSSNYTEIPLVPENVSGQFSGATGGTINPGSGGAITFPANSIADAVTGAAYSGTVIVSAFYLHPDSSGFGDLMPGQLTGINTDSAEKVLQSFGMIVVEMAGSSGQKLQLANGKTASISFPVPPALLAKASPALSLWYFDMSRGLWREQGNAALQGSNYVGEVSHFSYWSVDRPSSDVNFGALIYNKANTPVSGAKILIRDADVTQILYGDGYTDVTGKLIGLLPSNSHLLLQVFDHCGALIDTQSFKTAGPNTMLDLGIVQADISAVPVTFSGTLTDCLGNGVSNGIINIFLDGVYTSANVSNGIFSITLNRCYSAPATALVTGIDLSTNLQETVTLQDVTSTNVNAITLSVCSPADQFVYYTLKGITDTLTLANYSMNTYSGTNPPKYYAEIIYASSTNDTFYMTFRDTSALNVAQSFVTMNLSNYDSASNLGNMFTLTEFGPVGSGYVAGNFAGYLSDVFNGGGLVPIQGKFRIKRTN